MNQHEHRFELITIGIDPHKFSWTAVAVDRQGNPVTAPVRVDVTDDGFRRLLRWSRRWPRHRWAIENARAWDGT
ncbi:hypothetical protein [Streptomyces poonensis]|uniref:Transposase n=1 Tax=Streptomyces poonensis TaxID=68255 RepID=A0A918UDP7_9ACTN|nr:hypothetical protein [Streptomyces poonensis]GGY97664.1 hypothetical protein GCM10010365_15180 [Streptomyces poonensis]